MLDELVAAADYDTFYFGAILEVRIKDKVVFSSPVMPLFMASSKSGPIGATAGDAILFTGPQGDGFPLNIPIIIAGGTRFDVRLVQGAAFAAAVDTKVILVGILTTPD